MWVTHVAGAAAGVAPRDAEAVASSAAVGVSRHPVSEVGFPPRSAHLSARVLTSGACPSHCASDPGKSRTPWSHRTIRPAGTEHAQDCERRLHGHGGLPQQVRKVIRSLILRLGNSVPHGPYASANHADPADRHGVGSSRTTAEVAVVYLFRAGSARMKQR